MLRNSIALITGGAQGLGKGFAKAVLEAGGKVSLLDVKEDIGQKTVNEFNSLFGSRSIFIKCDVRKEQEVKVAFKKAHDTFGRLDLVVNNAGVFTLIDDDWQRTVDVNLVGVMRCCFAAAEYMSDTGGHIINISSTAGLTSVPFDPAYVASKHGVVGVSRCLADMWEGQSIRVNCICPSFTDTEMVRAAFGIQQQASPFSQAVDAIGLMTVDDVVGGFKKLLEDGTLTAGVLSVTPAGIKYRYRPRSIAHASKL